MKMTHAHNNSRGEDIFLIRTVNNEMTVGFVLLPAFLDAEETTGGKGNSLGFL